MCVVGLPSPHIDIPLGAAKVAPVCGEARFRNAARTAHQLRAIAFISLLRQVTQAATGLIGGFGRTVTAIKASV